jgi:hypothetical protein
MNEIKVTIELCKEDRQRLDDILYILARTCTALENIGTPFQAPAEPIQEETFEQPDLFASEPVDEPAPVPAISLADIQKKVVDLSTAGKKDAVKAVIQAYAPKVSAIPENKYAEVLAKLTELEG